MKEKPKRLQIGGIEQNATPSRRDKPTTPYDLPLEILDMILQKSYLHWILNSPTKQRDEEVIRSLSSVDVCFYQRIARKRFKRSIWRYVKDFYRRANNRSAIIRNNRNYLFENIQPNDELMASLLSLNCITQEQSQVIQRQRSIRGKNGNLLYVAESFDEAKFSTFVKCLRQNKQQTVARIIENRGGATKIELQGWGANRTMSMDAQLLHQKIEDLRNETKPWSDQTYKLISQLKKEGVEILSSRLERQTVVVWIWCRTQAALEYIQNMYESNELIDVFFENIRPSASAIININRNQFKKTIVVCPFYTNFTQRIELRDQIKEKLYSLRITKLRNKIYILSEWTSLPSLHTPLPPRPPSKSIPFVIHVFEDQHPSNWHQEIELTGITYASDIFSNEKENCLYVCAAFNQETDVWKITREEDVEHKIIKRFALDLRPHSLSMSNDGRFFAFRRFQNSLMIYRSDGELIRTVQLSIDILYADTCTPLQAVETSIGNFILLHRWDEGYERDRVMRWSICELSRDGQMVIRRFTPSNETQQLNHPSCISLDSEDRVFVADTRNNRVILLDSDLKWNRILIPTGSKEEPRIRYPIKLCYDEEKKQLIVGGEQFNVYSLSRK